MGSTLGAIKSAARKLRVTPEEYIQRRDAGERWCWSCRVWHPCSAFGHTTSKRCLASDRESKKKVA